MFCQKTNDIACMNLNHQRSRFESGFEFLMNNTRLKIQCLLIVASMMILSLGSGCNQQRYKPAKWRAAQRNAGNQDNGSQDYDSGTMPVGAWGSLPGRSMGTLPGRGSTLPGRGWNTLPGRGWNTLPGGGWSTLPGGGLETLPDRGGSTLPQRRWQIPIRGGRTLPERRWQDAPRRDTLPRRYEIKYQAPAPMQRLELSKTRK